MDTKTCPECQIEKTRAEFGRNRTLPDGLSYYCLACNRARARERYRLRQAALGKAVRRRVPPPPGMKWCADCQDHRPREAFGRNRAARDGLNTYCRVHHNARSRTSYRSRRDGSSVRDLRIPAQRTAELCPSCHRPLAGSLAVAGSGLTADRVGM